MPAGLRFLFTGLGFILFARVWPNQARWENAACRMKQTRRPKVPESLNPICVWFGMIFALSLSLSLSLSP